MVRVKPTWLNQANRRGQVVLLAAVLLVVALVPMILAYLQLGYAGDTETTIEGDPAAETERVLDRAVHAAVSETSTEAWNNRDEMIAEIRAELDPTLGVLEQSRLDDGIAIEISYNQSRAQGWRDGHCPQGQHRQFGGCEAADGVVVQDRVDETHVLAVAFDVRVTTNDGETSLTTVVAFRTE